MSLTYYMYFLSSSGDLIFSSPAIGLDGTIYVGSYDINLYAINPDGSLKWKYATGIGNIQTNDMIPTYILSHIYIHIYYIIYIRISLTHTQSIIGTKVFAYINNDIQISKRKKHTHTYTHIS